MVFIQQIKLLYQDFFISRSKKADFVIYVEQKKETGVLKYKKNNYIEFYQLKSKTEITIDYSISILQLSQLLFYLISQLLQHKGFLVHGAVMIHKKQATVFMGASGAGKSTLISLLKEKTTPFADDVFILKKQKNNYLCFQSPIFCKQLWIRKTKQAYPVKAIYFLKQSKLTKSKKLKKNEVIKMFIQQVMVDAGKITATNKKALNFIAGFLAKKKAQVFLLSFRKKTDEILKTIIQDKHIDQQHVLRLPCSSSQQPLVQPEQAPNKKSLEVSSRPKLFEPKNI